MSESEIPASGAVYTVETVEKITRLSRDHIVLYYRSGLVSTVRETPDLLFDDEAIHRLRRLAYLISEYGLDPEGLKMVTALMDELERLRNELRFLRE